MIVASHPDLFAAYSGEAHILQRHSNVIRVGTLGLFHRRNHHLQGVEYARLGYIEVWILCFKVAIKLFAFFAWQRIGDSVVNQSDPVLAAFAQCRGNSIVGRIESIDRYV